MRASVPVVPKLVTILMLSLPLLTGCGLKDDLYLPPPERARAPPAPDQTTDDEDADAARP